MSDAKKIVYGIIAGSNKTFSENQKTLLLRAVNVLLGNVRSADSGAWAGRKIIIPSPACYLGAWNWDSAFHALAVSKWNLDLALEQINIFFEQQEPSGLFPDTLFLSGEKCTCICKPPVFAWVLCEIAKAYPDLKLNYYYEKLDKNTDFWENCRKSGDLFHYDADEEPDFDEYEKHCRNESGWDTSVRWDNGAQKLWAIDLNCYMVLVYRTLCEFASKLNKLDKAAEWKSKELALADKINELLYNEALGCYFDADIKTGEHTKIYSPASFMPLFVQIADENKAKRLAELAADKSKFYPLMPTVSYDNSEYNATDYWRGPTWLNVAYFALKGLKNYGFSELVSDYKERILTACFNEKRDIFEYYNSKTGEGLGASGFGWSAVFIIEMLLGL